MKKIIAIAVLALLLAACGQEPEGDVMQMELEAMMQTDREFSEMSIAEGMRAAFVHYADDSVVVYRDGRVPIKGIDELRESYPAPREQGGTLSWQPTFADIAQSSDLGYTLGEWTFTAVDTAGLEQQSKGYYVTIWKKQPDGTWRFTFDSGVTGPKPDQPQPEIEE